MDEPLVFYQSKYHAWHFSTCRDWEADRLADGERFQCINAPVLNLKQWVRTQFRVGRHFNKALKRIERVYFAEYSKEFDEMPIQPGELVVWVSDEDKVNYQKRG